MRYLRWLIAAPFLLLLVLFMLSNQAAVTVTLWPTGLAWETQLWVPILAAMVVAFLLGAVLLWISELGQRRRARRAEQALALLEEQVKGLRANLAAPSSSASDPRST